MLRIFEIANRPLPNIVCQLLGQGESKDRYKICWSCIAEWVIFIGLLVLILRGIGLSIQFGLLVHNVKALIS